MPPAGPHGITLLFHAGLGGDVEIARLLVKNGAHDDQALHAAVWFNRYEMAKWLIENDTKDINVIRGEKTPLDLAIEKDHSQIVALLKEKGVGTRM